MKTPGKIIFLLLFFVSATMRLAAQTVILNIDRATDSLRSERGPNQKTFSYMYFKAGMIVGPDHSGARIIYGPSSDFSLGLRTKYKLGRIVSLGWEIEGDEQIYKLQQDSTKTLPDNTINKIERMQFRSLALGIFTRINFDPKRGNHLGYYLDLGISEAWNFEILDVIKNDLPDGSKTKLKIWNLPYTKDVSTSVVFRLAFNRVALFMSYRLTDQFKPTYHLPELPKIIAGFDIALMD